MSNDSKFIARPKVRFSQADADESKTKELKASADKKHTVQSNRPRIRSIVTLDKPVRVLNLNIESSSRDVKELKTTNNEGKTESLTVCSNVVPRAVQTTSLDDNCDKTECQKRLSDASSTRNIEVNSKVIDVIDISEDSSDIAITPVAPPVVQNESLDKVLKPRNNVEANVSKTDRAKARRGKENEVSTGKKGVMAAPGTTADLKVKQHKSKPFPVSVNAKKPNVTSKSFTSVASKKSNSKYTVNNFMPCHKHCKVASKTKASPIKKTLLRDIIGPKIKPYVGPGKPRKRQANLGEREDDAYAKPCTSGERLARPEYNSIMCTINKLNEMKKEKPVMDIEHLPATYKSLLNEKISSALDFPLDEAIYKNLVDLSIDEKQLPSRLTRSKDPEPRQRDAVPVLSDFFVPVVSEEYCTSISIKPRTPEIIDNWSAFRISDKIFEWKHILDHV
ncbi:uncharacterized protein LOC143375519 [Andrena cerasifolii]|uniref:uncharacterized protein LOC143375519 n=1 Tax=Andrena cerasifolii TaxID=2819439 RepID=UPI004037CC1D